jgi:hypothetical protein
MAILSRPWSSRYASDQRVERAKIVGKKDLGFHQVGAETLVKYEVEVKVMERAEIFKISAFFSLDRDEWLMESVGGSVGLPVEFHAEILTDLELLNPYKVFKKISA